MAKKEYFGPEHGMDILTANLGGGVPAVYHMGVAAEEGDWDTFVYYLTVEATVLAFQAGALAYLNWLSPKNRMAFHAAHQGVNVIRGQIVRSTLTTTPGIIATPIVASIAGAIGYEKYVNEPLRKAHKGADIDWFGPFASGFGSVV